MAALVLDKLLLWLHQHLKEKKLVESNLEKVDKLKPIAKVLISIVCWNVHIPPLQLTRS